jgi:deoxyribose-phosphate aldolase
MLLAARGAGGWTRGLPLAALAGCAALALAAAAPPGGARGARCEAVEAAALDTRAEARAAADRSLGSLERMIERLTARVFVAPFVDHTLLAPDATVADVQRLCGEAVRHGFMAVCVNGSNVKEASAALRALGAQDRVKVCAVVGFPLGASASQVKAFEAMQAIEDGATEIDMVINVGRVKGADWDYVLRDIAAVVAVCKSAEAVCKVILETSLLTEEEKKAAARISALVGADFVKTSTGFSSGGATVDDVKLLYDSVRSLHHILPMQEHNLAPRHAAEVKASGGIRTARQAEAMIRAGASRIGTSRAAQWCEGPDAQSAAKAY